MSDPPRLPAAPPRKRGFTRVARDLLAPPFVGVAKLLRTVLRSELKTDAGKVNLGGLVVGAAFVFGGGLLTGWQALIRTFEHGYSTGAASAAVMFGMWMGGLIICTGLVGLMERWRR